MDKHGRGLSKEPLMCSYKKARHGSQEGAKCTSSAKGSASCLRSPSHGPCLTLVGPESEEARTKNDQRMPVLTLAHHWFPRLPS